MAEDRVVTRRTRAWMNDPRVGGHEAMDDTV